MTSAPSIAVLGAGSFGTAVATTLARGGHRVTLLCRTAQQAAQINDGHHNPRFFPGHTLSPLIDATGDPADVVAAADMLFLAFPSRAMDEYAQRIAAEGKPGAIIVNLIKGLHPRHFTFAALFAQTAPAMRYVALKGPTFSRPLFLGEWSGMTCGADDPAAGAAVTALFTGSALAIDAISSAAAVDVASALKNVYAIALGLVGSTGPSENTTFMAATLVVKEVRGVLDALGCTPDVLWSFAGVGDILLTGLCDTSRNRTIGLMMGKGIPIDLVASDFVAEGVRAVDTLQAHLGGLIATPLLDAVAEVLHGRAPPSHIFSAFGGQA